MLPEESALARLWSKKWARNVGDVAAIEGQQLSK